MKRHILTYCLAALLLVCGCAHEATNSTPQAQKLKFDSWVSMNNDGTWQKTTLGSYIMSYTKGAQSESCADAEAYPFVLVKYTLSDLNGTVTSTNRVEMSQQLLQYKKYNYYGPNIINRAKGQGIVGLAEIIGQMYVGDRCTIAIPGWLLGTTVRKDAQAYLDNAGSTAAVIYDIEVVGQVSDLREYQKSQIELAWGSEPADSIADGVWWTIVKKANEEDKISSGNTAYVRYTCSRIDGQVVDTNIDSVGKSVFGVEWKNKSSEAMGINWSEEYSSITTSKGGSLIMGFTVPLSKMQNGQECIVYMTSEYGYGTTGSGNTIPPYAPLKFYISLTKEKE